jgi:uncharacterized membrane protein
VGEAPEAERGWRRWYQQGVSRWQAVIAAVAIGGMYLALPQRLRVGPPWLLFALVIVLLVPLHTAHLRGNSQLAHLLGRALTALVTAAVVVSVVFLAARVPAGKTAGTSLLRDAVLLWGANILVFALWYWEIDGGGPGRRRLDTYYSRDFIWPQSTLSQEPASEPWMPDFLDYLFLAFNTATAFSPTDTPVLSRRMKLLVMAQSLISLMVIAVLAARAINTL